MKTINISVTEEQYKEVEKLTKKLGFANRSEFFRALLRRRVEDTETTKQKLRSAGSRITDTDIQEAVTWARG